MLPNTSKLSFGNVVQDALKQELMIHVMLLVLVLPAPACVVPTGATCPVAGDTVCLLQQLILYCS